jgi:hypothetical protein
LSVEITQRFRTLTAKVSAEDEQKIEKM